MQMESLPLRVDLERPEGTYALRLEKTSEWSIAQQLINLDHSHGGGLMRDIRENGVELVAGVPEGWPSTLPTTGILEFNFKKHVNSESYTVLDSKKVAALEEELHKSYTSESSKISSIMTLAPYTMLYASQVTRLLQAFGTGGALVQAACVLFTRCVDLEDGAEEICASMPSRDEHCFREQLRHVANFRGANPTGHYEMALSSGHHRMLAIRLKDEAGREGSALTWKNVLYERTTETHRFPNRAGPPEAWAGSIPVNGHLAIDYVSSVQPPGFAQAASASQLAQALASCGLSMPNNPVQLPVVAELRPEQVGKWRAVVCKLWLTCAQIATCMSRFSAGPDRVEVAVSGWARCLDKNNLWTLLYSMSGMEQNVFITRISPGTLLKLLGKHISCNWFLDFTVPEHEEVAVHLVREAQSEDLQNWYNLKLSGRNKTFPENAAMLGFLTTESKTPIVHVNTLFQDSWTEVCKLSTQAQESMTQQERLEVRIRTAQRLNLEFLLELSPYFECPAEDRSTVPTWKSGKALQEAMGTNPPWLAVWNRIVRKMVRLKMRNLTEGAESPLKEVFLIATHDSQWMDIMAFEGWVNQSGFPTAICTWLSKQMSRIALEENAQVKGHATDINFNQFSRILRLRIPDVQKTAGLQKDFLVNKFINKLKAARQNALHDRHVRSEETLEDAAPADADANASI